MSFHNNCNWDWLEMHQPENLSSSSSSSGIVLVEKQDNSHHLPSSLPLQNCRPDNRPQLTAGRPQSNSPSQGDSVATDRLLSSFTTHGRGPTCDQNEPALDVAGIVNAYHQQTQRLGEIFTCKNEERRKTQAGLENLAQQIAAIRRQATALNTMCEKRPPGFTGDFKEFRRYLQQHAQSLDAQLVHDTRRLSFQDARMQNLISDMFDETKYKTWNSELYHSTDPWWSLCDSSPRDPFPTDMAAKDGGGGPVQNKGSLPDLDTLAANSGLLDSCNMEIPEWFVVLDSTRSIPLLGKGRISRYVELANRLCRLEETRSEEYFDSLSQGQDCVKIALSNRRGCSASGSRKACPVVPPLSSQPVSHGHMPRISAKDQYDKLMVRIYNAMDVVAARDREGVHD